MANDYGLSDSEISQINAMAAAAAKPNVNLMAGMMSGDPVSSNMASQLQAQGARAGAQRVQGLQGALQARAQGRDVAKRQGTLQAARTSARTDAAALARQQAEADYTRDRADEVEDLNFKRQQAIDLAELRNKRMLSQSSKEKARLNRQERRFRMAHYKTQQPKSLSGTEIKTLNDGDKMVNIMEDLQKRFKDSYVTPTAGIIGRMENIASQEFGAFTSKETDEQAAWWEDYKRFIELVERHEYFGATLTKGENISWKQAEINMGQEAPKTRDNFKRRIGRLKEVLDEYAQGVVISKKAPKTVKPLISSALGENWSVAEDLYKEPFPEQILEGTQDAADEKAIDDMTVEEMQEEVNRLKELQGG